MNQAAAVFQDLARARNALSWAGERLGSGDGEWWTLLTRQIAFEPLPASVLFALVWPMVCSGAA
jgi:hypothetical protein